MSASRPGAGRRSIAFFTSLRGRLLLLTVGFVLFAELLIYPLLATSFRNSWLRERGQAAEIAALAVQAAPDGRVSDELSRDLLTRAQVVAVAVTGEDFRELVLAPAMPISGPINQVDLRQPQGLSAIPQTFSHFFSPPGRFLQVMFIPEITSDQEMEVIVPEDALKAQLVAYSRAILVISIVTAIVVGALVYLAIYGLVVRPMRELTQSVIRFGESPDGADIEFQPGRSDEMRRAYEALKTMQRTVSTSFRQRKRLAELGESVAKINHDLRNSLATAQIVSEGLSQSDDPRVRRAAPRLERAIERAAALAEATLRYGRADPPAPCIQPADIMCVVDEAASEAVAAWPAVAWRLECPSAAGVRAMADSEHLHRIIGNVVRNAARAVAERPNGPDGGEVCGLVEAAGDVVHIRIADTGPGIPARVLANLFQPFSASGTRDGSGLGLAIARELARGMQGDLCLERTGADGTVFRLTLPAAP